VTLWPVRWITTVSRLIAGECMWRTRGRAGPHDKSITATGHRGGDGATRQSRDAEGYQHVPFAYAPPVEQDRQAERRLQDDAFHPELLGRPVQGRLPAEPRQQDRVQAGQRSLQASPETAIAARGSVRAAQR